MRPADPHAVLRTAAVAALLAVGVGCVDHDADRGDPNAGLPPVQVVDTRADVPLRKPMPPQDGQGADLPPLHNDVPIVRQQAPEEPRYAQAYANIGRPKIVVFVNRTVAGELVPVAPAMPSVQRVPIGRATNGDDQTAVYLQPGQYDEAQARSIDYELIEQLLAEDLSADGKVTVIAPLAARQRLSEDQVRDIQAGRPQMLGEVATRLNADVLIQVTAHPSRQTADGLGIRLVAEAVNTHGGQAIAFAAVDVPPPLTRPMLNEYTRFVARKLMDGMSGSWEAMGTAAPMPSAQTPPEAAPPLPRAEPVPPTPVATPPQPPPGGLIPATPTAPPASPPRPSSPSDLPPPP